MYKRILAAVNEQLNAEIAARYAMRLSRACDAKLYLCFVAEKHQAHGVIVRAEEALKRLFEEACSLDLKVETIIETGEPVRDIAAIVGREEIDIVFAATRRADSERRYYAGTIARRLSLRLPCSFALVRVVHGGRIHPKEILVPLKARIDSIEERAYFTAKTAQAFDARVVLFHAPKPLTGFFSGEVHLTPLEWEERRPRDIAHFMEHLKRYKVMHDGMLVPGTAGKTIATAAFSKQHDLIIMGASERGLLSSLVRGNPVEEVLRSTPCDLIILKPRHEHP